MEKIRCKTCKGTGLLKVKTKLCKHCKGKKCIKCPIRESGFQCIGLEECRKCWGSGQINK